MTLGDIIGARRVLSGITETIPFAAAYKIAKFVSNTEVEQKLFDDKVREIFSKYGIDGEIPPEKAEDANREFEELAKSEVKETTIAMPDKEFENVKLTVAQAVLLVNVMER